MRRRPPTPTLFPYTTLFRSHPLRVRAPAGRAVDPYRRAHGSARDDGRAPLRGDRKSTRLNSSHPSISYAVFCLKKKKHSADGTHNNTAPMLLYAHSADLHVK